MKAAVFFGQKDIRVVDVEEPQISKPNEVKIKVCYCGICGSDIEEYLYGPIVVPTEPHPLTGRMRPIILGHEFSGEVVDVGKNVKSVNIGDKVVVNPILSCGECYWCKRDTPCLCKRMACMGLGTDGAFAQYIVVPTENCYKVSLEAPLDKLALAEPTGVALRAIRKAGMQVGDDIIIIGAGTIGLIALQIARIAGANKIFVIVRSPGRIKLAEKMGASAVLNSSTDDIEKEIQHLTHGEGVNKIIVLAGNKSLPGFASALVEKGGLVMLLGISPQPCPININDVVISEKCLLGSHGYNKNDFKKSVNFIVSGMLDIDTLITKRIKLNDIVREGFEELAVPHGKNIKILVSPESSN